MKADLEQLENKGRLNMFQTAFVFSCIRPLFKDMLLVLLKNKKRRVMGTRLFQRMSFIAYIRCRLHGKVLADRLFPLLLY